ncbi:patatin-like phospholipase family protein [Oceanisphaera sp. W20_SRM_FM3]|uniref:patatin-like phospholipase family protein n=1 Tax=Oceanisphaera sp. W20_SRM_FM3 TaxID=3240267 RepID=UPI003F945FED
MKTLNITCNGLVLGVCLVLGSVFFSCSSVAQTESGARPKIGLALSGGGARGTAHVGVIRVLEQMHIPIDYIAGTSMGSIIGGLYASGMTVDEIEATLKTMDWEHIFNDDPPRKDRSFRRKRDDNLYFVKAKPGITDQGELKFPTGAVQGQKFDLALRELTLPISTTTDFDKLYIPFRAVASDIETGTKVVLSSGDLATAMRASMSVPGAFAATKIDGKLLVDGGITDNIPIDVVRDMGADIVIAVDISSPYMPGEDVDNLFQITLQLTSILTRVNADRQIATLTGRDVLIVPKLGDITSSDFTRSQEAIVKGQEAADTQRAKLTGLSLSVSRYQDYLAMRSARPAKQLPVVNFIRVENDSNVSDGMVRDRLHQPIGETLDPLLLNQDLSTIYGLDLFQTVQYDIIEEDNQTGLLVDAQARSWGPNYLQLGLQLSSDELGQSSYNLGLAYLRTGINPLNGELRLGTQLGAEPLIVGEWYQPLDTLSRYFVDTSLRYGVQNIGIYDADLKNVADYRVYNGQADLAFGREISVYSEARLGYRYNTGQVKLETGLPQLPEFSFDTSKIYGSLFFDRLDNFDFPSDGWLSRLEYSTAREDLGNDTSFDQFTVGGNQFFTIADEHIFGLGGFVNTTVSGTAEIQDRYRLGGFLNLSGFADNSLSGQQAAVVSALYYRRFQPSRLLNWYLGGSLEYGGVWEDKEDIGTDGIAAGSVFLGADTPIGPVYLGVGHAEGGNNAIFFYLARPLFY